ncbi:MAG: tetratricopeptide repeat protein [Sphingobacteriales bacterium]|jgi:Tfp pilus assembly protein PilF
MKKFVLLSCLCLLNIIAFSQTKPKPKKPADAPPTQKEMEALMKQAMDQLTPEDKRIMDSMGLKIPNMGTVPKVGDKALAKAYADEMRIVPVRDAARISSIPATPSAAAMPAYVKKLETGITLMLDAGTKTEAEKFYAAAVADPSTTLANAAIGLWMGRMPLPAIYLMSKAAVADPSDPNTINNFASMLTMTGAEQWALPMLMHLNSQYPRNSTVLNNIGQAWFGLGEISKAEQYLNNAIAIHPNHSQANMTKAKILESKGDMNGAAEAVMRSMDEAYNTHKADQLNKYSEKKKYDPKRMKLPGRMPADPLGLEKFNWPQFPFTVKSSILLEREWQEFKQLCREEGKRLKAVYEKHLREENEAMQASIKSDTQAINSGNTPSLLMAPPYADAATKKLKNYLENDQDGLAFRIKRAETRLGEATRQVGKLSAKRDSLYNVVREKFDPLIGQGKSNPLEKYCAEFNQVTNDYLREANEILMEAQAEYLELLRKRTNAFAYYAQYTNTPGMFEAIKANLKASWLGSISDQMVVFGFLGPFCDSLEAEKEKQKVKTLAEFDDIACPYNDTMKLGVYYLATNCSRLTGHIKLGNVEYHRKIDMDKDILLGASLEVSAGISKGVEKGPVSAEMKLEVKGKVEWDENKVTNWEIEAEAGVSAGTNVAHADEVLGGPIDPNQTNEIGKLVGKGDKSVTIVGATAKIGMNSGPSLEGKGLLRNITIK